MLCVPCYVLLCHAHILEGLYDLISVESSICETLGKKSHKKANREGRKSGRIDSL